MGTKSNPGPYNCHHDAEQDEPLFTLLARDPAAPTLVRHWANMRMQEIKDYHPDLLRKELDRIAEAYKVAAEMEVWKRRHRPFSG